VVVHVRDEEDADGPPLLGGQRLADRVGGLAGDDAVERALRIVLARLVVEDQDDLALHVQVAVVVVSEVGRRDAEAGEEELALDLARAGRAEGQGEESLTDRHLHRLADGQMIRGTQAGRDQVEAAVERPAGLDRLEAQPLEPRGDERRGQVVLGRRGQPAAEAVPGEEEEVGLHVPLADRVVAGRGRPGLTGPEPAERRRHRDQVARHAFPPFRHPPIRTRERSTVS
jgi:hypothetical protein